MSIDENKFSLLIKQLLKFKIGTTKIPIKDVSWEELIWATLVIMFGEEKVDWDSQSHAKSIDITVEIDGKSIKISAKSGEIKSDAINISSYRLTTFETLEGMLNFIKSQHDKFEYYLICARQKVNNGIKYTVFKVPASRLAPDWLINPKNWLKDDSGFKLRNGFDFKAKIVKKMSNQLWYNIPVRYFKPNEQILDISIPNNELGKGLIEFLENYAKENNIKKDSES
jgi:hypothetical protein